MKIEFSLKDDQQGEAPVRHSPSQLYYDAYVADFRIICHGEPPIVVPEGPALHFLTALQSMFLESFLTGRAATTYLFETGARMSVTIAGDEIAIEIPAGITLVRCPTNEFIAALKDATLKLLWIIYEHEPQLLVQKGLFAEGSIQAHAARLILDGKLRQDKR